MFYFPKIADKFFDDAAANVKLGDARWQSFWGALQAGPFNLECKAGHECVDDPQPLAGLSPQRAVGSEPRSSFADPAAAPTLLSASAALLAIAQLWR